MPAFIYFFIFNWDNISICFAGHINEVKKLSKEGDEIRKQLLKQDDGQPDNDSLYPIMVPPTPLLKNNDSEEDYEAEVSVYRAIERLKDIKGIALHSLEYTVSNLKLFTDYTVDNETGRYVESQDVGRNTAGECDILLMGDKYFVIIEVKTNPNDIYGGRNQCLSRELLIEAIFRKMQSRSPEPKIRPKIIKCVAIPLCVECEESDEVTSVKDGECRPIPIHTCTREENPQQKRVYILCEEGTEGSEVHTCPRNGKEYVYKENYVCNCTGLVDNISGTHLKDDKTFREWWEENVEPRTLQNSTDPADAFAAELYKKTGDVLIGLWRKKMERTIPRHQGSVVSLYRNVMNINKSLKDGRITYMTRRARSPRDPNAVTAPEVIKTYIGVEYLKRKQNEIFKVVTESTDQCLWIHGPAGSGKTVLLAGRVIQFAKTYPDKKILVVKSTRPSDPRSPSLYRAKCDGAGIKYHPLPNNAVAKNLQMFNDIPVTILEYQIDSDADFQEFQNVVRSNAIHYGLVVIDDRTGVNNQIDDMKDFLNKLRPIYAGLTKFWIATDIATTEICAEEVKDFATSNPDKKILILEIMRHSGPPSLYETACDKADVTVEVLTKKEYETDDDKRKQLKDIKKRRTCTVMILEQQVGSDKHMNYLDIINSIILQKEILIYFHHVVIDVGAVNNNINDMKDFLNKLKSRYADTKFWMVTDINTTGIYAEEVKKLATEFKYHMPEKKILVLELMRQSGPPPLYQTECEEADVTVEVLDKLDNRTGCTVTIVQKICPDENVKDYLVSIFFPKEFDLVVIDDCNGDKNVNVHIGQMKKFCVNMQLFSISCLMATDMEQRSSTGVGAPQFAMESMSDGENFFVCDQKYSIKPDKKGVLTTAKISAKGMGDIPSITILNLTENLRNTIDISNILIVIRDMSDKETVFEKIKNKEVREVLLPKQLRGHFIRGTLPLIHVFNEYKAKKDEIEKVLKGELRKLKEFNKSEVAVIYDDIDVKHFNSEGKWIDEKKLKNAVPIPADVKNVTVCTVDKCDSSEWPAVIVLLRAMKKSDKGEKPEVNMLNKLYTAVSRARVHCVVIFFPHGEETLCDETYEMCDLLKGLENLALIIRH